MMPDAQTREINVLRNLQPAYEARGLSFHINPPREMVPGFLGEFQPDAMALGPEGGIIIEVRHRRNRESEKQLAEIARTVSGEKGWEFRAIYLNPSADEIPPIAKPTPRQLQATFAEIQVLTQGGHSAAAFVAAWAALEALARLASEGGGVKATRGFSPIQAIQTLAEQGYLENGDADRLRGMVKLRNAVVHGDLSVNVPVEQVKALLGQLRALASDIATVMAERNAAG